jgi:glutamine cyclotransferase
MLAALLVVLMLYIGEAFTQQQQGPTAVHAHNVSARFAAAATPAATRYPDLTRPSVTATYHHDPVSFCQGLLVHNGTFYESRGQWNLSQLRKVDITTGAVLGSTDLPADQFAEGIVIWGGLLIQLTWRSGVVKFYNPGTLQLVKQLPQPPTARSEGWGITHDGTHLIESDGSSFLHWWSLDSGATALAEVQRKQVIGLDGVPVVNLNELEWMDGLVLANVRYSGSLFVIECPAAMRTCTVLAEWDYSELRAAGAGVFNGVAYDACTASLYVTGKLWPRLFKLGNPKWQRTAASARGPCGAGAALSSGRTSDAS